MEINEIEVVENTFTCVQNDGPRAKSHARRGLADVPETARPAWVHTNDT